MFRIYIMIMELAIVRIFRFRIFRIWNLRLLQVKIRVIGNSDKLEFRMIRRFDDVTWMFRI